jgi:hypothetical protein
VYENRALTRRIKPMGSRREELKTGGRNCVMRSSLIRAVQQILLILYQRKMRRAGYVTRMGEMKK